MEIRKVEKQPYQYASKFNEKNLDNLTWQSGFLIFAIISSQSRMQKGVSNELADTFCYD